MNIPDPNFKIDLDLIQGNSSKLKPRLNEITRTTTRRINLRCNFSSNIIQIRWELVSSCLFEELKREKYELAAKTMKRDLSFAEGVALIQASKWINKKIFNRNLGSSDNWPILYVQACCFPLCSIQWVQIFLLGLVTEVSLSNGFTGATWLILGQLSWHILWKIRQACTAFVDLF